jgi:hypothetical protein
MSVRTPMNRRQFLERAACGFGALAFNAMAATREPHYAPKAKNVIFLFMDGGPSQMDTFNPKPRLNRDQGKPLPFQAPATQFNIGNRIYGSPFAFQNYGQSGAPVSELFPNVAKVVDHLTFLHGMVSDHSEHTAANYFMHSGSGFQGRPGMGAWIHYGLGSPSENLPGYVVLESGLVPPGGMDLFNSGFLPATHQATLFRQGAVPVADLAPRESSPALQREKLQLLSSLTKASRHLLPESTEIDATIQNYELAFRMQSAVPELTSLEGESELTRKMYGIDEKDTMEFGRQCLIARRMVERGVRFIELLTPFRSGLDRWDQHSDIVKGHRINAKAVDQPIAALIQDLHGRGMLKDTLVLWGGEFGRTPCAQADDNGKLDHVGRDHNPYGFTMWMAGGGLKPGISYGQTDEFGYFATENKVHVHDLHATILHLLGLDHKRLTYRYSGRDMRLTDVHGELVKGILA